MQWFWLLAVVSMPAYAQPALYACGSFSQEYVVGAKLSPSGLFRLDSSGQWQHLGYKHPIISGFTGDPSEPGTVYIAAGNGVIRASEGGTKWQILTGSDITEVREVNASKGTISFGYTHGIRISHDGGKTWAELAGPLRRKFTESLRPDPRDGNILIAGTEQGLWRTEDAGKTWGQVGASGYQVTRLEVSPHDACHWIAGTEGGGLFVSRDCGKSFETTGRVAFGQNIYDLAFDPAKPGRIAVAGWGFGVVISEDGGKTWTQRNQGLPRPEIMTITFDPSHAGHLYAGVNGDGVFVSDDAGVTWRKHGLEGGRIVRLRFLPGGAQ